MFGISSAEFAVVLVVALLIVGPKQLPDVLRTCGRTYRKLNHFIKKVSQVIDDVMYDADRIAEKTEKTLMRDQCNALMEKKDKSADEQ